MSERMTCCLCGRAARELHHVTQRDIDPETMLPLCHDHHQLMDDDWNAAGIPANLQPATCLHSLQLGMHRVAMFLQRLAAGAASPLAADICLTIASWLAKWALRLKLIIEAFDDGFPGWRDHLNATLSGLSAIRPASEGGCSHDHAGKRAGRRRSTADRDPGVDRPAQSRAATSV